VSQLIADLCSSFIIEVIVQLVVIAFVVGGGMMGDLLVASACIGSPQFVEDFEVVSVEDVSCLAYDSKLNKIGDGPRLV